MKNLGERNWKNKRIKHVERSSKDVENIWIGEYKKGWSDEKV